MGHLGADGPSFILSGLYVLTVRLMLFVDRIWGNFWCVVRGVVAAAKGDRASWRAKIRKILEKPVQEAGHSGLRNGVETGATPQNYVASIGGLAYPSGRAELFRRVARVREALPDDVGVVAVDGVLLDASNVRQLANSANMSEYVVIVGPYCVATAYQVGLVTINAFSVVEDLKPERAVVHPLVPKNYCVESSFPQVVARFVASILTLVGVITYGADTGMVVNGIPAIGVAAFVLNLAARMVLRPGVAQAVQPSKSNHNVALLSPPPRSRQQEEGKASEEEESRCQGISVVRARPDKYLLEFLSLAFPGALYGLSALSQLPGWMRWAMLSVGGLSSILFTTSGCLHSRLTGGLSALLYPVFASTWVSYLVIAVVVSPVSSIVLAWALSGGDSSFILAAWPMAGIILGTSALAGKDLAPAWVLYTACASFLPGTVLAIIVEVNMVGSVEPSSVRNHITTKYFPQFEHRAQDTPYHGGYGHEDATGLNVRYVPVYVDSARPGVSVVKSPGDAAGTCWVWVGG